MLPEMTNEERLNIFKLLTKGNIHCWSKSEFQADKARPIFDQLLTLAKNDPYFLAHLVSREDNTKDLNVLATIANAHSDADGSAFSPGSEFRKPNLRSVSQAKMQSFDPKLALRAAWLAKERHNGRRYLNKPLTLALTKYLRYREANQKVMQGAADHGMKEHLIGLYRILHLAPSDDAVRILGWKQKDGRVPEAKENPFEGLTPAQIAKKIRGQEIPFQKAISQIPNMTPVIGWALAGVASDRQLVIYTATWEDLGLFKNPEFVKIYAERTSKIGDETDRVRDLSKLKDAKDVVEEAKAEQRKKTVAHLLEPYGIRRVFIHVDLSPSMAQFIPLACKLASIIAESIPDPAENLRWGWFDVGGMVLPLPEKMTEDGFHSVLYGYRGNWGTNTVALYRDAREFQADTDIWITDGQHNSGDIGAAVRQFGFVQRAVIIKAGHYYPLLTNALEQNTINVTEVEGDSLDNANKFAESLAVALKGEVAVIEEIMSNKLLSLPKWWNSI